MIGFILEVITMRYMLLVWLVFVLLGVYALGAYALPKLMDTRAQLIEQMEVK
jgi:hypothetical protein